MEPYNAGIDWWALGVIIYELLFGFKPFVENNFIPGTDEWDERVKDPNVEVSFPDRDNTAYSP